MYNPRPNPEKIAELNANPRAGYRYIHKKTGVKYRLCDIGTAEYDGETKMAIYYNVSDPEQFLWVRPLAEFAEKFKLDLSQFDD